MNVNFSNTFGQNTQGMNEGQLDQAQARQITELTIETYRQIRESGLLKSMGQDLLAAGNALRNNQISNDVAAYKAYKEAGMPENLIMVLMTRPRIDAKNIAEFVGKMKAAKGKSGFDLK